MKCIVPSCGSDFHDSKNSKYSKHRFPKETAKRLEWIKSIAAKDPQIVLKAINFKCALICSKHFASDCFSVTAERATLRKTACPTLFEVPQERNRIPSAVKETVVNRQHEQSEQKPVKTIRYVGDISENLTNEQLSAARQKIKLQFSKKQHTIKRLRAHCRRMNNKVISMEQLLEQLKSKHLVEDVENSPLQVKFSY
ncbi:THAP domain-containing protein 2-like [Armigeres subalbatus]|uniref:THAP domain-containing protein 2-like n=1 Tax=Armigeres subalbatus TaxID=124917 RepID=UPI002ED54BC3